MAKKNKLSKSSDNRYTVILADVPWPFKVYDDKTGNGRSALAHYQTMTIQDIADLPIKQLAAKNCVLYFWTLWPSLFESQKIINAWGFKYKTLGFEWWKLNKGWRKYMPIITLVGQGSPVLLERLFFFGMGYYTRANSEPCLLATRGSMPVAVHNERNFIIAPIQEHSRKPDEVYEKIERLPPGQRYLELFARRRRPGWDAFGNEIEGSIELPGEK